MHHYTLYAQTIRALVWSDLIVFKQEIGHKIIDNYIHVAANLLVMGYILPQFGLNADFGIFILASLISSTALFDSYPLVANLVSDITGEKKITYDLLLPILSWLVFVRMIITSAIQNTILCCAVLPFGALFFAHKIDLASISYISLFCMIIVCSIFAGSFGIVTASLIQNMQRLSRVWVRFLFPLWYFGGFQFSFTSLKATFPHAAYVNLLNPILYCTEGLRDAILGTAGPQGPYIAAIICIPVLVFFTILCTWMSVIRFKKRLDFV